MKKSVALLAMLLAPSLLQAQVVPTPPPEAVFQAAADREPEAVAEVFAWIRAETERLRQDPVAFDRDADDTQELLFRAGQILSGRYGPAPEDLESEIVDTLIEVVRAAEGNERHAAGSAVSTALGTAGHQGYVGAGAALFRLLDYLIPRGVYFQLAMLPDGRGLSFLGRAAGIEERQKALEAMERLATDGGPEGHALLLDLDARDQLSSAAVDWIALAGAEGFSPSLICEHVPQLRACRRAPEVLSAAFARLRTKAAAIRGNPAGVMASEETMEDFIAEAGEFLQGDFGPLPGDVEEAVVDALLAMADADTDPRGGIRGRIGMFFGHSGMAGYMGAASALFRLISIEVEHGGTVAGLMYLLTLL